MRQSALYGLIVPIITPVDDEEKVDEVSFRKIVGRLIGCGVQGLFIGGSAGEGSLLSMKEWSRMVETAFQENKSRVHLLGGVMDTSTARVKEKIRILKNIGYKNIVLTPSYYYTLRCDDEFIRLFGEAKEASGDMELIAYNIPSCTVARIPVEVLSEMTQRGWIHYCKESSGDLVYLKEVIQKCGELGLKVFMGDEATMDQGLLAGACGVVPVCANYDPETFIKIYQASVGGNITEVRRLQGRINDLRANLVNAGVCWLAGLKYAVACLGMGEGEPVSPLQPLSAEQKKKVKAFVASENGKGVVCFGDDKNTSS